MAQHGIPLVPLPRRFRSVDARRHACGTQGRSTHDRDGRVEKATWRDGAGTVESGAGETVSERVGEVVKSWIAEPGGNGEEGGQWSLRITRNERERPLCDP